MTFEPKIIGGTTTRSSCRPRLKPQFNVRFLALVVIAFAASPTRTSAQSTGADSVETRTYLLARGFEVTEVTRVRDPNHIVDVYQNRAGTGSFPNMDVCYSIQKWPKEVTYKSGQAEWTVPDSISALLSSSKPEVRFVSPQLQVSYYRPDSALSQASVNVGGTQYAAYAINLDVETLNHVASVQQAELYWVPAVGSVKLREASGCEFELLSRHVAPVRKGFYCGRSTTNAVWCLGGALIAGIATYEIIGNSRASASSTSISTSGSPPPRPSRASRIFFSLRR